MVESQRLELGRGAVAEWLGRDASEREDLDPMVRPPIAAETLFIHGDLDERVPLELSRKYLAEMEKFGKEIGLEILTGTSHFEMMEIPSPTFEALLRAIN
jgi:pimeloyl-ACP methyl ester carboxylesterase